MVRVCCRSPIGLNRSPFQRNTNRTTLRSGSGVSSLSKTGFQLRTCTCTLSVWVWVGRRWPLFHLILNICVSRLICTIPMSIWKENLWKKSLEQCQQETATSTKLMCCQGYALGIVHTFRTELSDPFWLSCFEEQHGWLDPFSNSCKLSYKQYLLSLLSFGCICMS